MEGVLSSPVGQSSLRRWIRVGLLIAVAVVVVGSAVWVTRVLLSDKTLPGIRLDGTPIGALTASELEAAIHGAVRRHATRPLVLTIGQHAMSFQRGELGATVDVPATRSQILALGRSGNVLHDLADRVRARFGKVHVPLVTELDPEIARRFFASLKQVVDRAPTAARLDLQKGVVVRGAVGYHLHLYDSIAATETALRRGDNQVALVVSIRQPEGGQALAGLDVSQVLAQFTTMYSLAERDKDRAYNLRLAASKLDGYVLKPGATLSFNDTVGPRTEAQGYRMAPTIEAGELVDGMAGGACQLSSTLFAASFFAGLELVSSRPHTIPSSYIKLALDAAVAYPNTDLVLKNPYDFPVVVGYTVSQGKVTVQIRGKARPWEKVVFRRVIKRRTANAEQTRPDPRIPSGTRWLEQAGVPGFAIERERLFFRKGESTPAKVEKREVRYPATTQITRIGTGPANPAWKPPYVKKPYGDVADKFSMAQ